MKYKELQSRIPPHESPSNGKRSLFSFITQNWRGQPLYDLATVVNLISNTSTRQGLTVRCEVDETKYEKGIKVTKADLATVNLKPHDWHGDWNDTVKKRAIR